MYSMLPTLCRLHELRVLHGSMVGARIEPDFGRAVVRNSGFGGNSRPREHEQSAGLGDEVEELFELLGVVQGRLGSGHEERSLRRRFEDGGVR